MCFFVSIVGPSMSPSVTISMPMSANFFATSSRTSDVLACGFVKTKALCSTGFCSSDSRNLSGSSCGSMLSFCSAATRPGTCVLPSREAGECEVRLALACD